MREENTKNARLVAYNALLAYKKGAYSNLALNEELNKTNVLEQRDRAFASMLFYKSIEQLLTLDYYISKYATKRVSLPVRCVLYIGICQILYMDVADHAAINESVKLCKVIGKSQSSGFVNAVLRKVAENQNKKLEISGDELDEISVINSYPSELLELLCEDYSLNQVKEIIEYNQTPPKFVIRANKVLISGDELTDELNKIAINFETGIFNSDAIYIEEPDKIFASTLYSDGKIAIQGESSMIVGKIVSDCGGDNILDACAAPGGKTAYIAQYLPDSKIQAWDIYEHRVELISKNCARLGVKNVVTRVCDSSEFDGAYKEKFDTVLVDVPCTGSGVIQKKPDIKYVIDKKSVSDLVELQCEILWNCSKYVKVGGCLIYSTCSILSCEDENQIQEFLKLNDKFEMDKITLDVPEYNAGHKAYAGLSAGELKFYQPRDEIDGFYIAKLKRVK